MIQADDPSWYVNFYDLPHISLKIWNDVFLIKNPPYNFVFDKNIHHQNIHVNCRIRTNKLFIIIWKCVKDFFNELLNCLKVITVKG